MGFMAAFVWGLYMFEEEKMRMAKKQKQEESDAWIMKVAWQMLEEKSCESEEIKGSVRSEGLWNVVDKIERDLGISGRLSDEVEYRLGLRDVEGEYKKGSALGNRGGEEMEILDAYSDYLDRRRE